MGCYDFNDMIGMLGHVVLFRYQLWRLHKPDVVNKVSMITIDKRAIKRKILGDMSKNFVDYITIVKFNENHKFYDLIVDIDYIHIYDFEGEI